MNQKRAKFLRKHMKASDMARVTYYRRPDKVIVLGNDCWRKTYQTFKRAYAKSYLK